MAKAPIQITALKHDATRKNIPTAEFESVMRAEDKTPVQLAYERRNRDLDPQLVWRGKDEQDWSNLIVQAPPLYIQEKVHPQVLIEDLKRQSQMRAKQKPDVAPDLFADFNGLRDSSAATEFYQHDQHWANRMICGDSLSVMASLAEREGLRLSSIYNWFSGDFATDGGVVPHLLRHAAPAKAAGIRAAATIRGYGYDWALNDVGGV